MYMYMCMYMLRSHLGSSHFGSSQLQAAVPGPRSSRGLCVFMASLSAVDVAAKLLEATIRAGASSQVAAAVAAALMRCALDVLDQVDEFDTDRLKSIPERLGRFLFLLSPPFFSIPFEIRKRKIRSLMILKHRSFSLQRKGGLIP